MELLDLVSEKAFGSEYADVLGDHAHGARPLSEPWIIFLNGVPGTVVHASVRGHARNPLPLSEVCCRFREVR